MKTFLKMAATAALGLGLAVAGTASAQVSGKGGPVMVGGDTMHLDQHSHTQNFDGRVEVIQDDARLRADHVKITYAPGENDSGFGEVQTIEASGNVYYVTPDSTMKGDLAVYTKSTDTMVLTGDVILQQGQNVLTGNRLVDQVSNGVTTLDAVPTGASHGRVKGVFYPDAKKAPAAAAPAQ